MLLFFEPNRQICSNLVQSHKSAKSSKTSKNPHVTESPPAGHHVVWAGDLATTFGFFGFFGTVTHLVLSTFGFLGFPLGLAVHGFGRKTYAYAYGFRANLFFSSIRTKKRDFSEFAENDTKIH